MISIGSEKATNRMTRTQHTSYQNRAETRFCTADPSHANDTLVPSEDELYVHRGTSLQQRYSATAAAEYRAALQVEAPLNPHGHDDLMYQRLVRKQRGVRKCRQLQSSKTCCGLSVAALGFLSHLNAARTRVSFFARPVQSSIPELPSQPGCARQLASQLFTAAFAALRMRGFWVLMHLYSGWNLQLQRAAVRGRILTAWMHDDDAPFLNNVEWMKASPKGRCQELRF